MTRRRFLISVPLAGALPSYAFGVEPHWLERTFHTIRVSRGGPVRPVRILQLSDLHISPFVPWSLIEKAVDMGLLTKPDLVCLTGDFVTRADAFDQHRYIRILRRLSSAAPTYACLGNHDGGSWAVRIGGFSDASVVSKLLADSQVSLLHNRSEIVSVHGQPILLVGVGDLWNDGVDGTSAFRDAKSLDNIATVLLAHNPDSKDVLAVHPWDLMLSGHTHGGQVLVPLIGTRFVPVKDKRFIAGLHGWNGRQIYVSRGVGSLGGVRINCRPEVTVLELTA